MCLWCGTVFVGEIDQGIRAYQKAVELRPNLADIHYNLGISYRSINMFDQAEESFRQAVTINDDDADAWYNLGVTYLEKRNFPNAVKALQQTILLELNHMEAHYRLGCAFVMMGDENSSRKELDYLENSSSELASSLEDLIQTHLS